MLKHLKWLTLLSLDAPIVAVAWQALISKSVASSQNWHHFAIVSLSVWLGYSADRWFDTLSRSPSKSEQHSFYLKFRNSVLLTWILVLITAVTLSLTTLETSELLKGLALMCSAIAYTLFAQRARSLRFYPIAKTAFTSALILAATLIFQEMQRIPPLPILSIWLLFFTNCLLIRTWSHPHETITRQAAFLGFFSCAVLSVSVIWTQFSMIGISCFLSLLALTTLHLRFKSGELITKRALADICLLTPILPLLLT
ncbi:hypothetical protein [Pelagicoccus mobilis]|uniref:Uncharacterized protein n=1 Tax=Pelagicoccus mobilis TaxID=415221 RepID=A0A934VS90_9BACT|nr:hypothetical protein [Pelagicoccus mobilis]MBK1878423.1 hypothetical protein [Pelagicoccus mobilis]